MKYSLLRLASVLFFVASTGSAVAQTDQEIFDSIDWQAGPGAAALGSHAEIDLPDGLLFTGKDGAQTFLKLTENLPSGSELGLVLSAASGWFVIFEFDSIGYVKDDEKDRLDADAILASIRAGTEAANEELRDRGWATLEVVGWKVPPRFNDQTKNLEWATMIRSSEGGDAANFNTRLLGRQGVMNVTLVAGSEELASVLPSYEHLIGGYSFNPGYTYAEYKAGDKLAEYGLTALIGGGALAVAAQTGLLKKFWKLIVLGVAALIGFLKKILGGSRSQPTHS